jgi:DNA-binding IclR family transcriptional regulator
MSGMEALVIAKIQSPADTLGGAWIGQHIDLHCTAQGKALLSTLSDKRIHELYAGRQLGSCT